MDVSTFEIEKIENEKAIFKNSDMTHRFGRYTDADGKIVIRPQSCGNPSPLVRTLDSYIRAINYAFNVTEFYSTANTIVKFETIETANEFLISLFKHVNQYKDYFHIGSFLLSEDKKFKKHIMVSDKDNNFLIFKINDNFTLTKIDYSTQYSYNDNDLYYHDFVEMKIKPNTNCKVWVKTL
jgi:hypothetical protein